MALVLCIDLIGKVLNFSTRRTWVAVSEVRPIIRHILMYVLTAFAHSTSGNSLNILRRIKIKTLKLRTLAALLRDSMVSVPIVG